MEGYAKIVQKVCDFVGNVCYNHLNKEVYF